MRKILTLVMLLSATTAFATDNGATTGNGYRDAPGILSKKIFDKKFAMQFKPGMSRSYIESVVGVPAIEVGTIDGMLDVGWQGAMGTQFELYVDKATGKVQYWILMGQGNKNWIMRPTGKIDKYL